MKKMKIATIITILILKGSYLFAQNVGINLNNPIMPLTIKTNGNGFGLAQYNGNTLVRLHSIIGEGGTLQSSGKLHFATMSNSIPAISLTSTGLGIGLGGVDPAFLLDLKGRMRIQHDITNNLKAAFSVDGVSAGLPNRAFFGTINDNTFGILGDGAGNAFAMNVTNGNIGLGTIAPTAKLDLNGSLKIRGTVGFSPRKGSVMVSTDANGTGKWQGVWAFRAGGLPLDTGGGHIIPANIWTKLDFALTAYNTGLMYQPVASQFVAPVKGIYHINTKIEFSGVYPPLQSGISLVGTRNGVGLTLPNQSYSAGTISISGDTPAILKPNNMAISVDLLLEAGDIIWVTAFSSVVARIDIGHNASWFSGRLVTRL